VVDDLPMTGASQVAGRLMLYLSARRYRLLTAPTGT